MHEGEGRQARPQEGGAEKEVAGTSTASASLTFASLFLGLVVGVRPVRVVTTGPVAAVVYRLDGRAVARSSESPWAGSVDFGAEFSPHELVARAFDAKGREIALERQWINLPRPPAEVEILIEKDKAGRSAAALLTWASRMGPHPDRASLTFDGRELALDAAHRAKLPAFDASTVHVLTAQIEFPNDVRGRTDLVLGGGSSAEAGTELTGVPIRSADGKMPSVESLAGRLERNGVPLRVTSVERGAATLVVVRELVAPGLIWRLRALVRGPFGGDPTKLEPEDRLQVQWPVVREVSDVESVNVLFEASRMYPGSKMSIAALLTEVAYPEANSQPRRFADAVAAAGLQAAPVLLSAGGSAGARARRQGLEPSRRCVHKALPRTAACPALRLVARPHGGLVSAAAWGTYTDVTKAAALRAASARIHEDLRSQSIAWVEGRYLPQEITLVEKGDGLTIAR